MIVAFFFLYRDYFFDAEYLCTPLYKFKKKLALIAINIFFYF